MTKLTTKEPIKKIIAVFFLLFLLLTPGCLNNNTISDDELVANATPPEDGQINQSKPTNQTKPAGPGLTIYANKTDKQISKYIYGQFNNITKITDKNNNERYYTYYTINDPYNGKILRKLEKEEAVINGVRVTLAEYKYHADGNLKTKTEYFEDSTARKRETAYIYEDQGLNLTGITVTGYPDGETYTINYTYDQLGRKKTETLKRRESCYNPELIDLTTEYEYNALDQIIKTTDPQGSVHETIYDQGGKVHQRKVRHKLPSDEYVTRTYETNHYDEADRLVGTMDTFGNETFYDYDEAGYSGPHK